jgi:hypothetical protein
LVLIHVHLGDLDLVTIFASQLFQNRADHLARTTPLSPEVEENRFIGLENVFFERSVSYIFDAGTHENSLISLI